MSEERQRRDRSHLQHEAEHSRPRKRTPVLTYLALLFAAAFLLLLLSYFMQQRTNQEALSGLTDSVNNLQWGENLFDTNQRLIKENSQLKEQVEQLQEDLATTVTATQEGQVQLAQRDQQLLAMDQFWRIQRAYSRGAKAEAKRLAQEFEKTGLPSHLPTTGDPSAAQQYDALLSAMGMAKATP